MCNLFSEPIDRCLQAGRMETADGIPRFTHVHGSISPPLSARPGSNKEDARPLRSWYGGRETTLDCTDLCTMFDRDHVEAVRKQLASLIDWAQRVVFLGIGYHQEMLDLLNIKGGTGNQAWLRQKVFVGGTAVKLDRGTLGRLSTWAGGRFVVGDADEHCTAFLARHLSE